MNEDHESRQETFVEPATQAEFKADDPRMAISRCPVGYGQRYLSVRGRAGALRVVMIWQVLGTHAPRVVQTTATEDRARALEELRITFKEMPESVLEEIVSHLRTMPWVLDAWCFS